jgi:hypothetical protein
LRPERRTFDRHWCARKAKYAGELEMRLYAAFRRGLLLAALVVVPVVALGETVSPPNGAVYAISPKDGGTVTGPFKVQFGLCPCAISP